MDDYPKSRTQLKKEDKALQKLGESLVSLSTDQIADIELPDELREAVDLARKTRSHGARRRQLKYIGKLLRGIDCGPIRQAIQNLRAGDLDKIRAFKKIERWRDALKAGNRQLIEEILEACPQAERQRLTQLARNAHAHADSEKAAISSRQLFRYLKEISGR
jgi:ribosome-associated protein